MRADFIAVSSITVPKTYSWDLGEPLFNNDINTTVPGYTTERYVSGYAPGVKVLFLNTSNPDPTFSRTTHDWNFGDFYNDQNNTISLSCISFVEHTYIMPGKYTVTLEVLQTQDEEDQQPDIINPLDLVCRGKGGIKWFWDALDGVTIGSTCIEWSATDCQEFDSFQVVTSGYDKIWGDELACLQKYCKLWSWKAMERGFIFSSPLIRPDEPITDNPVRWKDTKYNQPFIKKWMYEANDRLPCFVDIINIVDDLSNRKVQQIVEVIEIPPVAGISCMTNSITGISPFTVVLSPSACKPGSFPIDRIDWNFGDGTPTKTITRYTSVSGDPTFIKTNLFFDDLDDIRNFNVQHTYHVNKNTYPVFYPSLTCYSANTYTSDSCSTIIGPITLPSAPEDLQLIKSKNTTKGLIYAFNVDKNITYTTTTIFTPTPILPTSPSNKLVNSLRNIPIGYGYNGITITTTPSGTTEFIYPRYTIPTCEVSGAPIFALLTESGPALSAYIDPNDGPEIPIQTELNLDLLP